MADITGIITDDNILEGVIEESDSLAGEFDSASLIDGDIIALRGPKGEKGDKGDPGRDGVTDYTLLTNRPQIEGVTLDGDKTFEDLNLAGLSNLDIENMLL